MMVCLLLRVIKLKPALKSVAFEMLSNDIENSN